MRAYGADSLCERSREEEGGWGGEKETEMETEIDIKTEIENFFSGRHEQMSHNLR